MDNPIPNQKSAGKTNFNESYLSSQQTNRNDIQNLFLKDEVLPEKIEDKGILKIKLELRSASKHEIGTPST